MKERGNRKKQKTTKKTAKETDRKANHTMVVLIQTY